MSIQISGPSVPPDGSVTAAKINSGNAGDGQVLTADGNGGAAWEAPAGGGAGYLKYVALLAQTGTSAPVPTVLENTLGAIAWTRAGTGEYHAELTGAFREGKTFVSVSIMTGSVVAVMYSNRENNNFMYFFAYSASPVMGDAVDDWTAFIEIRVYP